jgi:hypothetical protein
MEREGIEAVAACSRIRLAPTILSGRGNLGYGGGYKLAAGRRKGGFIALERGSKPADSWLNQWFAFFDSGF